MAYDNSTVLGQLKQVALEAKKQKDEYQDRRNEHQGAKINIDNQSLKRDIFKSKVSTSETKQAISDLQERQKNQATMDYQYMQGNKQEEETELEDNK